MGDMIARGILLAFKDLEMKVPVVVRIRGSSTFVNPVVLALTRLTWHRVQIARACSRTSSLPYPRILID